MNSTKLDPNLHVVSLPVTLKLQGLTVRFHSLPVALLEKMKFQPKRDFIRGVKAEMANEEPPVSFIATKGRFLGG